MVKSLGHYSETQKDNEAFDQIMIRYGPQLHLLSEEEKYDLLRKLVARPGSLGQALPKFLEEIANSLSADGRLALAQAVIEQLRHGGK